MTVPDPVRRVIWPAADRLPVTRAAGRTKRAPPFLRALLSLGRRGFPFQLLRSADPDWAALRAAARRALLSNHPPPLRLLLRLAAGLGWPLGAALGTAGALRATPPRDRPHGLFSWIRRGADMLVLALLQNIPPRDYLLYRLHAPDRRSDIGRFLFRTDLGLLGAFNRSRGADMRDVRDKARFAALCRGHGFPAVPTLAAYRGGRQIEPQSPFLPDQTSLWVKDLAGSQGSGASQWDRDGAAYRNESGRIRTPGELAGDWRRRDCIVQPRLDNHAALAALSDGPLVDLRIITGLDPPGRAHLVAAYALLPCTDPAGRRWYAMSEIALGDGSLVRTTLAGLQPLHEHPNTGVRLDGIAVPDWPRCRDLTLAAHAAAFPRFAFLGWDVAPTPDGPVLIEANDGWDPVAPQLALGRPLGLTPFASLAAAHLERLRCG